MSNIVVQNLSIKRGEKQIYENFSQEFEERKVTVLLAPSGAGKTTLLDFMAGLVKSQEGQVSGIERISYLFQEPRLLPWYSLEKNVFIPVAEVLDKKEAEERCEFFLHEVELDGRKHALPRNCSGGERQRCALARAFAYPSSLLLMDEAFQSQDILIKLRLMELTEKLLKSEKRTVILVTHDVREALCLGDKILFLSGSPLSVSYDISCTDKDIPIRERYISPGKEMLESESLLLQRFCAL